MHVCINLLTYFVNSVANLIFWADVTNRHHPALKPPGGPIAHSTVLVLSHKIIV